MKPEPLKDKGRVVSVPLENLFGLPERIRIGFSYFELLAIKECIEYCFKKDIWKSYLHENNSYTALEKIKKKANTKHKL